MKDGKPEVLIIGEAHPVGSVNLETVKIKEINRRGVKKLAIIDTTEDRTLLVQFRKAGRIISRELTIINSFGAQKLFFELPLTEVFDELCTKFASDHNFEEFRSKALEEAISVLEKISQRLCGIIQKFIPGATVIPEKIERNLIAYQLDLHIIKTTQISNVSFFDNEDLFIDNSAYVLASKVEMEEKHKNLQKFFSNEWKKIAKHREPFMIENIKKAGIPDRSVIICGAAHVEELEYGLADVAYVHESLYLDNE